MNPSSSSIVCTIEDPAGTLAFMKANVRKITDIVERPCLSIFNYPLVYALLILQTLCLDPPGNRCRFNRQENI